MIGSLAVLILAGTWKRNAAGIAVGVGMLLLGGCVVGPKYQRPAAPIPPAYKETGNWKIAQPKDEKLGGNWWEIFGDPQLNTLEQQVNVSNQNLKAAAAQYQQALALLRYNRANYYLTLTT